MPLRILLVDDHTVLRSGLRLMLQTQPDLEVVGEAADGPEALEQARMLKPDLVILDLSMPGMTGLELLQRLQIVQPAAKPIILTMHDDAEFLRTALTYGARGYVLKRAADTELLTAIRQVGRGESYVYPSMASKLVLVAGSPEQRGRETAKLSVREQEVLQLIARGYTHQEIADQLCVSVKTVEAHKARIAEKLKLRTRAELVRYAAEKGLV